MSNNNEDTEYQIEGVPVEELFTRILDRYELEEFCEELEISLEDLLYRFEDVIVEKADRLDIY